MSNMRIIQRVACNSSGMLETLFDVVVEYGVINWEELSVEKSTHKAEVVEITMQKHGNADSLSVIPVYGYTYVGRTADWEGVAKAAYLPPDSLVDTRLPEFAFLAGDAKYDENSNRGGPYARIRAKKLRGVVSYGLMIPVPDNIPLGTDVAETYGILHYEAPIEGSKNKNSIYTGGEVESGPNVYAPKYDIDSFQRYAKQMFNEGEAVHVTEKIHGANGRWVFHDGRIYCGSRTEWKREFAQIPVPSRDDLAKKISDRIVTNEYKDMYICGFQNGQITDRAYAEADKIIQTIQHKNEHPQQIMWWKALRATPILEQWLYQNPDIVVYGEAYGAVQNLKYGVPPGEVRIAVFDLLCKGNWLSVYDGRIMLGGCLPWVPIVAHTQYNFDKLVEMAEGQSLIPGAIHYREGVVVKPMVERNHPHLGRVQLKIISPTYLEKS